MKIISIFFIAILLIVVITFGLLNASPVELNYYFGKIKLPLSLLLFVAFLFGTCLGWLIEAYAIIKLKYKNWKLQRSINSQRQS